MTQPADVRERLAMHARALESANDPERAKLARDLAGVHEDQAELRAEIRRLNEWMDVLRGRNTQLHRRCQIAEKGLRLALEPHRGGPSFGRALANSAARMYLARYEELEAAIRAHRDAKADDRCIEDDDRLYEALGDGIKCDRRVGDKAAMLANCARFIERRCQGGHWPTYQELEALVGNLLKGGIWPRDGACEECFPPGQYPEVRPGWRCAQHEARRLVDDEARRNGCRT